VVEGLLFCAKDAVVVVDDFAPCGSQYDIARIHQRADRVIRAQGNHTGRGRIWNRAWAALTQAGSRQCIGLSETDPAKRFIELLISALNSAKAHLADSHGGRPPLGAKWG